MENGPLVTVAFSKPQIYYQVYYMGEVCLNLVGIWRYGFKEPMWIMTTLAPEDGLALYDQRMKIELVVFQLASQALNSRTIDLPLISGYNQARIE